MHAACGFSGTTVIPAGEEARRLGVLPLHVLLDSFDLPRLRFITGQATHRLPRANARSYASRCSIRSSAGEFAIFAPWRCCRNTRWLRAWDKREHACNAWLAAPRYVL